MSEPRSFWKGSLRLSLVIIPVRLVSATKSEAAVRFHQVDRKTKQRIRYQKTVPGKGPVEKEDIVSGYEVEPGSYVLFEGAELDAVKLKTRHTIELTQFVETCEIDSLYFETPYYLLPDGEVAEEGYCVIRDALRAERKVGIGQLTLRGRENLVVIEPVGQGLAVQTMRYDEEVRDADAIFEDIGPRKLRSDLVDMAQDLIRRKSAPFDPSAYENHYAQALRALVKEKLDKGKVVDVDDDEDKPAKGNVVDFMEALRKSVAGDDAPAKPSAKKAPAKAAKPAKAKASPKAKAKAPSHAKAAPKRKAG